MLTHAYMPSATVSESENPTYTLSVLDTQEFMRGFMSALGKETFAYYWNQGWPPEMLIYLLVERVEIKCGEKTIRILNNYPDSSDPDLKNLKEFATEVKEFLGQQPKIALVPTPKDVGPPIQTSNLQDLDKLVKLAKEDSLSLSPATGKDAYQLKSIGMNLQFTFSNPKKAVDSTAPVCTSASAAQKNESMWTTENGFSVSFALRSPDALLNYLGDLTRVENRKDAPKVPVVCIQKRFQPLFEAFPAGKCPNTLLSVESAQGIYSVPALDPGKANCEGQEGELQLRVPDDQSTVCDAGTSMQAFRLLNQVISLQKSAKDLPAPALVRVIGN
ncbi:MAG TPA: hypothetical protein VLX28_26565 [Thermoanaerobaculia bacterium]|nr:hypothetical protein [Thermoanaerobaculia bacterium]